MYNRDKIKFTELGQLSFL